MSTLAVVLIVVAVVLLLLILGGMSANARHRQGEAAMLRARIEAANEALAQARAADRGWERDLLESAARDAFAARSGAEIRDLQLVQVLDRPGTEEDEAVFRVVTDAGAEEVRLGRRDGAWVVAG